MTTNQPDHPPRIVVGVDGSEPSTQALRWAAHFAASAGARLDAVAAWQYPNSVGWGPLPVDWNPGQDMETALTQAVDAALGGQRPENMRLAVHEGNPAKVLLDESNGALMLIVGSRGHGGFAGLLLGSVSANVAEHATCPVLVVHGDQLPPERSA